jgi:hypothetical protein
MRDILIEYEDRYEKLTPHMQAHVEKVLAYIGKPVDVFDIRDIVEEAWEFARQEANHDRQKKTMLTIQGEYKSWDISGELIVSDKRKVIDVLGKECSSLDLSGTDNSCLYIIMSRETLIIDKKETFAKLLPYVISGNITFAQEGIRSHNYLFTEKGLEYQKQVVSFATERIVKR